ncbi:hypothetical protein BJY52DRAFT_1126352, partial [Lactarius psammicola]
SGRSHAFLSPRLSSHIPFAVPSETRVDIFQSFIVNDKHNIGTDIRSYRPVSFAYMRYHALQFDKVGDSEVPHSRLCPSTNSARSERSGLFFCGITGGRDVFKEVSIDLSKRVFDSDRGHWPANKKNELYPSHGFSTTEPYSLNWYRFIAQGAVCGKILVDVGFAGFFLAKLILPLLSWLGKQCFLDDFVSLDPDLYQGLVLLRHCTRNLEDLSLNFTVADSGEILYRIGDFGSQYMLRILPSRGRLACHAG